MTKQFLMTESQLSILKYKIEASNKVAAKLNQEPMALRELEEQMKQVFSADGFPTGVYIRKILVSVEGTAPRVSGWSFVGVIDHGDEGNVVRTLPDITAPLSFHSSKPVCEHCNKIRSRKRTALLMSDQGQLKQVGLMCLKDFTGHKSPEALFELAMMQQLLLDEDWDDDDGFGARGGFEKYCSLKEYLSHAVMSVNEFGWRRRDRDAVEDNSTATDAWWSLFRDHSKSKRRYPTEEESARAKAIVEWFRGNDKKWQQDESNYIQNMRVLMKAEFVAEKHIGFVASVIPLHDREMARIAQADAPAAAGFAGVVGERIEFARATVTRVSRVDGYYGMTTIVSFTTDEGFQLTWFATQSPDLEAGDVVKQLKATVKEHKSFKDMPQTTITRAKFTPAGKKA